jgi:hypothetical protein
MTGPMFGEQVSATTSCGRCLVDLAGVGTEWPCQWVKDLPHLTQHSV